MDNLIWFAVQYTNNKQAGPNIPQKNTNTNNKKPRQQKTPPTKNPANKKLHQTILSIRNKTHPYQNKQPKKIDFTKYNPAQINEITNVLQTIQTITDQADQRIQQKTPPTQKRPGRPKAPPKDIVKVQLMETYFAISDRIAEGFFNLFREKLAISSEFCYKTIERGYDPERCNQLIEEILKITNEIGNTHETKFSIDGTGDPCTLKVNYESKRSQQRTKKQTQPKTYTPTNSDHNRGGSDGVDCFAGKRQDFVYSVFTVGVTTKGASLNNFYALYTGALLGRIV